MALFACFVYDKAVRSALYLWYIEGADWDVGGQGDANDYSPILLYIQQTQRMADCLANWRM